MYIKHATFLNIGPHKELRLGTAKKPLPRGTIGIFGPNGCGKSTATNGLIAALRNDFTEIADKKQLVICDSADPKARDTISQIQIVFNHADHDFTFLNSIKPDKITLCDAEGNQTEDWVNVAAKLEEIGIQTDVLNAVFLRQNAIDNLFSSTPTVRASLYQRMLTLGNLAGLAKTLPAFTSARRAAITVIDQTDNIRIEMERLGKEISIAKETQQGVLSRCMTSDEYQALRDSIALIAQRETIEREIKDIAKRYQAARDKVKDSRETLKCAAQWRIDVASTKKKAEKATAYLKEIREYRRQKEAYEVYQVAEAKAAKAKKALDDHVIPPFDQDKASESKAKYLSAKDAYTGIKDWVDSMKSLKGKVKCPTCQQNIADIAKMIEKQEKALEAAQVERDKWKAEVDKFTVQFNAQKSALEAKDRLQSVYMQASKLVGKPVDKPTIRNAKEMIETIQQVRIKIKKRNKTVKLLREAKADVKSYSRSMAEQKKTLDARKLTLSQLGAGGEDRTAELEQQDTLRGEAARLGGQIDQLKKSVKEQENKLEDNKRRLAENSTLQHRLGVIDQVGELFHPRRLPLRVSRACLHELEPAINRNLQKFGGGFACRPTDDLDLMVKMPGRKERSIRRLSIGQRVVMSLCFWLAQLELFAGDIGMLVLDEPTANLDEKNRRYLGEVLKNVSRSLRNRLQMIVISHDPLLKSSFDRVIEVG